MKKQIALIIVSMLAAMSTSAQNVNENFCNNEMCRIHTKTPICEMGEGVIQPNLECFLGTCPEDPDFEVKPDVPEKPDIDVEPDIPEIPDVPEAPEEPGKPEEDGPIQETPQSDLAMQVFSLVNAEREKYGLSRLTYDSVISKAADVRAGEIKTMFSHTRPDGRSCFTALDEVGYSYRKAGENIAYGQKTATEVMNAWMNSEGHRANILGDYNYIGIGVYEQGGTIYWTQFFAS